MNTFEKLTAIARTLPALDSPIMTMIKQQQDLHEKFQRLSGNHLNVFKQAAVIAKYPSVAGLSALDDLRSAAISFPKQADWMINERAATGIARSLTFPGIAALDGLRTAAISFPKQTDWLAPAKSQLLSNKMQATILAKSLSGLGSALSLGIDDRLLYPNKHLKSLANAGVLASVAAIPTNTLASISNIVAHQAKFHALGVGLAAGFSEYRKPPGIAAGIYPDSLQSTLKALSRTLDKKAFEFTTSSVIMRRWDAVENFDILFNEAIELTESIADNNGDLEAIDARIIKFIDAARVFLAHHLTGASWFSIIFILLSHFNTIRDTIDVFTPKPQLATKQDFLDSQKEIKRLRNDLSKRIERSVTIQKCTVYLKPNTKSLKVSKLSSGAEVELLDINRRWAHVSFSDEKDNYLITGWVLKKYLRNVKGTIPCNSVSKDDQNPIGTQLGTQI